MTAYDEEEAVKNAEATDTSPKSVNDEDKDDEEAAVNVAEVVDDGVPLMSVVPDNDDDKDEQTEHPNEDDVIEIPLDSFSMFYVAETWHEHLPPIALYCMQMWILALITKFLAKTGLGFSPVDVMVQILTCLIVVFTSGDLVDGLLFIGRPIRDDSNPRRSRRGTRLSLKWEISNFMRLSEGAFTVVVSFIFIAKSQDVVQLFQDFAAMAFVSQIDDGYFELARRGLFGKASKNMAERVSYCSYHSKKKTMWRFLRYAIFALIPLAMMIALGFLVDSDILRPVSGTLTLHMEHDGTNVCSACKAHRLWPYYAYAEDVCVPYPREPLQFEAGDMNGTAGKAQLGLYLNATHFSVFASSNGTYFPKTGLYPDWVDPVLKDQVDEDCKQIFSIDGGATELLSFRRNPTMEAEDRTLLNFAVLMDRGEGYTVVKSGDAECFFTAKIKEEECDGSQESSLSRAYYNSSGSERSAAGLIRAWVEFDLKVMADL
ncbi:hypothetical protein THAOC_21604 [Thalassiosira oceanica]|uniref:Uncharacterized protein n=2 Tax=Thalassiosira oceanica TaxID=159749 RepID=K0SIG2_THAOC|nr:hypothetical protein THAOC_21604 [Thalassiosira oceanica]|eukprot:EJK58287.1 hypothetical protein THAOC_21604 [Thalassiosira oceanica]